MGWMRDETGLDKTPANYVPLTPLSHLARAAKVFPDREALVYGDIRLTYRAYPSPLSLPLIHLLLFPRSLPS